MEQTSNIGLNIWDTDDPVSVAEVNANFQRIDGQGGVTLLNTITFSDISVNTIELDMSAIPFHDYDKIVMKFRLEGDDATLSIFLNEMNTSGDYQVANPSVFYDTSTFNSWSPPSYGVLEIPCNTKFVSSAMESSEYANYKRYCHVTSSAFALDDITTMTIYYYSSTNMITGGSIEIWGVKEW